MSADGRNGAQSDSGRIRIARRCFDVRLICEADTATLSSVVATHCSFWPTREIRDYEGRVSSNRVNTVYAIVTTAVTAPAQGASWCRRRAQAKPSKSNGNAVDVRGVVAGDEAALNQMLDVRLQRQARCASDLWVEIAVDERQELAHRVRSLAHRIED